MCVVLKKNLVNFLSSICLVCTHVRLLACMPLHMVVIRGQLSGAGGYWGPNSAAWSWQETLYPLSRPASPMLVLRDVPDSCIQRSLWPQPSQHARWRFVNVFSWPKEHYFISFWLSFATSLGMHLRTLLPLVYWFVSSSDVRVIRPLLGQKPPGTPLAVLLSSTFLYLLQHKF